VGGKKVCRRAGPGTGPVGSGDRQSPVPNQLLFHLLLVLSE